MRKFAGLGLLLLASVTTVQAGGWNMEGGRTPSPKKEQDLIAVLHSDAPKAKKADACKDLAVYGSEKSVPELGKLLADDQLAGLMSSVAETSMFAGLLARGDDPPLRPPGGLPPGPPAPREASPEMTR